MVVVSTGLDKSKGPFEPPSSVIAAAAAVVVLDSPFPSVRRAPSDSGPAAFYDTFSSPLKTVQPPLPEPSTRGTNEDQIEYSGGDGSEHSQALSMPGSSADSGRQSGSARPRLSNTPGRRHQPPRPPFPTPPVHTYSPGPHPNAQDASPSAPDPTSGYPAATPHYQTPSPFTQRAGFVGPPYIPQQQQYPYPGHPGMHASESLHHLGYSPAPMVPIMQQHTPVYQFQGHSQEGASTSQHPFTSSASHHPSPPPHPPLSPLQQVSASTSGAARHASPYVPPQGGYSQLGYPTPSQYGYASPSSFGPSSSLYPPQYGAYSQSYGTSDQDGQGTWWYLPPGGPTTTSYEGMQPPFPYGINYPPMASHDGETYGHSPSSPHPAASTPASPSHARPPNPSRFGGSSSQLSVAGPSSVRPVSASSAAPVRTAENPEPSTAGESERHPSRRPYHPNPPAHRSEWVMWAGNVPSDATHDELWRFFNQPLSRSASTEPGTSTSPEDISDGVVSIFLISRSNCAFVNFESERHLNAATVRFNGVPLRPADPRCPRLVCRIRRQTDDLRAGVGGQRGIGMHTKWIKEQREKAKQAGGHSDTASAMTTPEELGQGLLKLSLSDDDNPRNRNATSHSNSSGSFASTTSSVMARYFPRRYFILKSLTQFDLDLSVQRGVWATQRHNEGILDQAFRTSQEVFLIFGVNKSGEFYGYAKMAGPVSQGESKVPWASPLASSQSSQASKGSLPAEADSSPLDHRTGVHYFLQSDGHYVDESPAAVSSAQDHPPVLPNPASRGKMASAPAELGDPHQRLTHKTPQEQMSLNDRRPIPVSHPPIELDDMAPYRNLKDHRGDESEEETRRTPNASGDRGVATEAPHPPHVRREVSEPLLTSTVLGPVQESVKEEDEAHEHPPIADAVPPSTEHGEEEVWGQPFRIQWVRTERLPFYRTRHLRNPWNHGREVKVSRDGTELEPSVGQQLLDEWDRPPPSPSTSPAAAPRPPAQRRGSKPPH